MKPEVIPTPIVAKAEDEVSLPGFSAFINKNRTDVLDASEAGVSARLKQMQIAREILAYASRPEVIAEVERLNNTIWRKPKGGRKVQAHTVVMREIAARCKVTPRSVRAWVAYWIEAAVAMGLPTNCPKENLDAVITTNKEQLAAWIESLTADDTSDDDDGDEEDADADNGRTPRIKPEVLALRLGKKGFKPFVKCQGEAGLEFRLNPSLFKPLFETFIRPICQMHGIKAVPMQKTR